MLLMAISIFSFADYASKYVQGYASSYVLGPASSTLTYVSNYNPNATDPLKNNANNDADEDDAKNEETNQHKVDKKPKGVSKHELTLGDSDNLETMDHKLLPLKLEPQKINSIE